MNETDASEESQQNYPIILEGDKIQTVFFSSTFTLIFLHQELVLLTDTFTETTKLLNKYL